MRKGKVVYPLFICCLIIITFLSACGNQADTTPAEIDTPVQQTQSDEQSMPDETKEPAVLLGDFATVYQGAEVSFSTGAQRVEVTVRTDLGTENAPDNWSDISAGLIAAVEETESEKPVSAQLEAEDGTILITVFSGEVKYDAFQVRNESPEMVEEASGQESEQENVIVYVTKTGTHYHSNDSCNGGTYYTSTLYEAQQRGLTPCAKCYG